MEIEEIIIQCKKDDQIAQAMLFDMYYQQMYHLSMRILFNIHDVEDVLSITFTKVFSHIRKFNYQGQPGLKKWIKTITINESIRYINSRKRIVYEENLTDYEEPFSDEHFDNNVFSVEEIYAIIENMPVGYRLVFNLFAIEEYNHKEIAETLGISINTSKSQLNKARKYIIQKLKNKR